MRIAPPAPWRLGMAAPPWLSPAVAPVAAHLQSAAATAIFGLVTFAGTDRIGLRAQATRF